LGPAASQGGELEGRTGGEGANKIRLLFAKDCHLIGRERQRRKITQQLIGEKGKSQGGNPATKRGGGALRIRSRSVVAKEEKGRP